MESVTKAIQNLGCKVHIIPGGCTGLVQPVDVGANKPFKGRVHRYWRDWLATEGFTGVEDNGKIKPPKRILIAEWCVKAFKETPQQVIFNTWRKTGNYTWFVPTVPMKPVGWINPITALTTTEDEAIVSV